MTGAAAPSYGAQFASFYDRVFPADASAVAAADRLAALHLADAGPPLELGVGTGRIARPLSERVGTVVGVDCSAEMLAELERAPGAVQAVEGDMRDYRATSGHGLVYCVLGSLSVLGSREEQRAAIETAAAAAAPGAAVVFETHNPAYVEGLHAGRPTQSWLVPYPSADTALFSQTTLDPEQGIWDLAHVFFDAGRARVATERSLLIWPAELDELALGAGLELEDRRATWAGGPAQGDEPLVVSTYRARHFQGDGYVSFSSSFNPPTHRVSHQ